MDLSHARDLSDAEKKRLAPLLIYEVLRRYSDCDHPMKQENIIDAVRRDYGLVLERRAVGRDVRLLSKVGCDIGGLGGRSGIYLISRDFEDSELRLLIDGVLSSRNVSAANARSLIGKLCGLSNVYFESYIGNVTSADEWPRDDGSAIFLNIELVDDAISRGRQMTFTYNRYGPDKTLHPSGSHRVSPYQTVMHNQRYYLLAYNEEAGEMYHYRLDRIRDIRVTEREATPLKSVPGYEYGISYRDMVTGLPYMYSDALEPVVFLADKEIVDQVVDWFGEGADISDAGDRYRVFVRVSPQAMEYWAMQYLNHVEVVAPRELREKIAGNLADGLRRYSGPDGGDGGGDGE